ncbi:DUF6412 domain-containing protein [Leifsonia sp. 22587]|uniref:DUF6412 domain-containing protein n=1 Tax=Leifsonia sp. 22587 TaxID=3453946 RepID=UPI003F8572B8
MTALLELLGRAFASGVGSLGLGHVGGSTAGFVALAGVAGALGLVAVLAAAAVRSVAALAASLRVRPVWSRPVEPAAGWLAEGPSDPAADGRPRPRAPGFSLPVA